MNQVSRPIASRMTLDEFLIWDAPGPLRWQLVDGEAVEMAPTSELHGVIQSELNRLIGNHLLAIGSSCRIIDAPGIVPRVRAGMNFRIPDVGVSCSPISSGSFVQQPVMLAEILSPSNENETRANIWAYTTIPSVHEILLLLSSRIEGELLRREADGNWPHAPALIEGGGMVVLESIGFTVPLAEIYRRTGL